LSIQNYSNAGLHNPKSKLATTFGSKKEKIDVAICKVRKLMTSYMCYN
jgi:hypothetical protein